MKDTQPSTVYWHTILYFKILLYNKVGRFNSRIDQQNYSVLCTVNSFMMQSSGYAGDIVLWMYDCSMCLCFMENVTLSSTLSFGCRIKTVFFVPWHLYCWLLVLKQLWDIVFGCVCQMFSGSPVLIKYIYYNYDPANTLKKCIYAISIQKYKHFYWDKL
jgi:hypothetical protein